MKLKRIGHDLATAAAAAAAAAASAKLLQLSPTLCNPIDVQPTRLLCPGDSPGKNTGVGCHFLLQCMKVKSESEVTQLCPTLSNPWTAAHQAPSSVGFSRQENWNGVPLPSATQRQNNNELGRDGTVNEGKFSPKGRRK